jgi:hypothetical protein
MTKHFGPATMVRDWMRNDGQFSAALRKRYNAWCKSQGVELMTEAQFDKQDAGVRAALKGVK